MMVIGGIYVSDETDYTDHHGSMGQAVYDSCFGAEEDTPASSIDNPSHYESASEKYRPILRLFGFESKWFEMKCIDAIIHNAYTRWLLADALLFNAVTYLWRAGQKGDEREDLNKALWYLERWLVYPQVHPGYSRTRDVEKAIELVEEAL